MEQIKLGDTPEQLGQITAADAMMVDGKIVTRQQVVELMAERDALAAQVDSLLDDRKAFVKKEFQLLKEIERLEIELKKRDEQSAALAAQVEALREVINEYRKGRVSAERAINEIVHRDSLAPQQHLREVRAEAGRAGFVACLDWVIQTTGSALFNVKEYLIAIDIAKKYADRIRNGKGDF